MPDQKSMISICETNPVLALLHQQNRHYPLEIISRLFRDEYANEAPLEAFLRVCSSVREDLQMREGGGYYMTPPAKMLDKWCDSSGDAQPWFAMTEDPRRGKTVSIRPAARQAFQIAVSADENADAMSGTDAIAFFDSIANAAAHLRQDKATTIARLRAEIREREDKIKEIDTLGMSPVTEANKQAYAIELSRFISELLTTIGKQPARLRENVAEAREAFYNLEGSHGEILRTVMEMMNQERRSRGYQMLQTLNGIHYDARNKRLLEDALNTILVECREYLYERTLRDARGLFRSLSDVSLRILSEDHHAVVQMSNFAESEAFERRRGQSRLLMELSETLRSNAHHMRLRLRGVNDVPGFEIGSERHEEVKLHWFDLSLCEAPPAGEAEERPEVDPVSLDPEVAREMAREATAKGAYLDVDRLKRWIAKIVEKNGDTPLSKIIEFRPLKYGLDEVAAFTDIALSKLPAEFRKDWSMEIALDGVEDADGNRPCAPGSSVLIRCPDPVFTRKGKPGQGADSLPSLGRVPDLRAALATVAAEATHADKVGRLRILRP